MKTVSCNCLLAQSTVTWVTWSWCVTNNYWQFNKSSSTFPVDSRPAEPAGPAKYIFRKWTFWTFVCPLYRQTLCQTNWWRSHPSSMAGSQISRNWWASSSRPANRTMRRYIRFPTQKGKTVGQPWAILANINKRWEEQQISPGSWQWNIFVKCISRRNISDWPDVDWTFVTRDLGKRNFVCW